MPYILKEKRLGMDKYIEKIVKVYEGDICNRSEVIEPLVNLIEVNGDLNYVISKAVWTIFERNKRYATADFLVDLLERVTDNVKAHTKNCTGNTERLLVELCRSVRLPSTLGTLLCVQLEFYRRRVGVYENLAAEKNGDIEL